MKISIKLGDSVLGCVETLDAEKVGGALCVHRATGGPGFRVTHIATTRALPAIFCCKEEALTVARQLIHLDWEFTGEQPPARIVTASRRVLNAHLKTCIGCYQTGRKVAVG